MRARIHTIIVEELYMLAIRRSKLSHIYDQPFSFPNYIRYFALAYLKILLSTAQVAGTLKYWQTLAIANKILANFINNK
jgi:hypothetical protein